MRRKKRKPGALIREILAMEEHLEIPILQTSQEARECPETGKIMFQGRSQAMLKIRKRQKQGAAKLRAYLCEHCSTWHITSSFHK